MMILSTIIMYSGHAARELELEHTNAQGRGTVAKQKVLDTIRRYISIVLNPDAQESGAFFQCLCMLFLFSTFLYVGGTFDVLCTMGAAFARHARTVVLLQRVAALRNSCFTSYEAHYGLLHCSLSVSLSLSLSPSLSHTHTRARAHSHALSLSL